uniref:Uncharacterized protein n=1 Tax=Arundo donax TaxID=35708 RepID=A0A0A9F304_ARUDO
MILDQLTRCTQNSYKGSNCILFRNDMLLHSSLAVHETKFWRSVAVQHVITVLDGAHYAGVTAVRRLAVKFGDSRCTSVRVHLIVGLFCQQCKFHSEFAACTMWQ